MIIIQKKHKLQYKTAFLTGEYENVWGRLSRDSSRQALTNSIHSPFVRFASVVAPVIQLWRQSGEIVRRITTKEALLVLCMWWKRTKDKYHRLRMCFFFYFCFVVVYGGYITKSLADHIRNGTGGRESEFIERLIVRIVCWVQLNHYLHMQRRTTTHKTHLLYRCVDVKCVNCSLVNVLVEYSNSICMCHQTTEHTAVVRNSIQVRIS